MTALSEADRARIQSYGLDPDKAAMAPLPTPTPQATVTAPAGVDPHTMPIGDIVFDKRTLDGFDLKTQRRQACDHLFALYKSPRGNSDRNRLLWNQLQKFVTKVALERKTGGHIKEVVKAGAEAREAAQVAQAAGIDNDTLGGMAQLLMTAAEKGMSMADLLALVSKTTTEEVV